METGLTNLDLPDLPSDTTSFEQMIAEVSDVKKENGDHDDDVYYPRGRRPRGYE